jgi:hypothetical protein
VGLYFVAPSLNNSCIAEFIEKATEIAGTRDLILAGDWNARVGALANDTLVCARGRLLIEQLTENNLILAAPENPGWTCMNHRGQSVVDHIITNSATILDYSILNDSLGGSDHRPLIFSIPSGPDTKKKFQRWNIRKLSDNSTAETYKNNLAATENQTLRRMDLCANIDQRWDIFKIWVEAALTDSCGILKYSNVPNRKFWTTDLQEKKKKIIENISSMENLINSRQQAPIIAIARNTLCQEQLEYRKLLLERRTEVFTDMVKNMNKKQNSSSLMRYVRNCKSRKSKGGCKLDPNLMDAHRNHFLTTFGGDPLATEEIIEEQPGQYTDKTINLEQIKRIITDLSLGTAPGADGLMPEVYFLGGEAMLRVLLVLVSEINRTCVIPDEWKTANVALIYKNKGPPTEAANYRPISLTITARRIYEKLVITELDDQIKLLSNTQGGFRRKRSTLHQVYAWAETNFEQHKKNDYSKKYLNVLLDFRAAYDMVDRRILWNRLKNKFNVSASIIARLRALFDHNSAVLLIKGRKSEPIKCKRGLLQGSSLSPILFNFFIDDMLVELKNCGAIIRENGTALNNLAFADDVVLIAESTEKMQQLLLICERWSIQVGMRFAPTKCSLISSKDESHLKIYNQPLPCSPEEKYLGININEAGINFTKLAKERTDKAKGIIATLRTLGMNFSGFSVDASSRLYKAFIRPVMEYGLQLSPATPENLRLYQGTQNLALRTIFSAPKTASTNALHKLALVEKIQIRNNILNLKFVGKLHNSMDGAIPAVRIWRSEIQSLRKGSLTELSKANPLWTKGTWSNHLFNRLGNSQTQPIALDKSSSKKIARQSIVDLDLNATNVAGGITVEAARKHRFILRDNSIAKHNRITITRWLIGIIAMHQPCRNCPDQTELSRSHAQVCSGALTYLQTKFEIPLYARSSPLNHLLNIHRHSTEHQFYEHIASAIGLIYEKCLDWCQAANGFWIPRIRDNAQDTIP